LVFALTDEPDVPPSMDGTLPITASLGASSDIDWFLLNLSPGATQISVLPDLVFIHVASSAYLVPESAPMPVRLFTSFIEGNGAFGYLEVGSLMAKRDDLAMNMADGSTYGGDSVSERYVQHPGCPDCSGRYLRPTLQWLRRQKFYWRVLSGSDGGRDRLCAHPERRDGLHTWRGPLSHLNR